MRKNSGTRELFDSAMKTAGLAIAPLWESTSTEALTAAVINGLGVSMLPYALIKNYIIGGRLYTLSVEGLSLSRKLSLIRHKDNFVSPAMNGFIDCFRRIAEAVN